MRIGLALPHYDYSFPDGRPVSWERVRDAAQRAEALGFDSIWISDHLFLDIGRYGAPPGAHGTLEPFTALAALATVTERIRLGTLVASAPFRHPAIVAKMAVVIDLVSGGRFDLGLGAGWFEPEFDAFGIAFGATGERFALLEETVAAVAALFGEGPVSFEGPTIRLSDAYLRPAPVRVGGPPIWLGGKGGERLLRLVARHASGWNVSWRITPEAHLDRVDALRRICREHGREPSTVGLSVGLYTLVGEDARDLQARYQALQEWAPGGSLDGMALEDFADGTLTGPVDVCLSRLAAFAANGVREVIVNPSNLPFAVSDWSQVELIAAALLPAAREL